MDKRTIGTCAAVGGQRRISLSGLVRRLMEALRQVFRPSYIPHNLNARLRRDAGLDEIEFERDKLARAPLIR